MLSVCEHALTLDKIYAHSDEIIITRGVSMVAGGDLNSRPLGYKFDFACFVTLYCVSLG